MSDQNNQGKQGKPPKTPESIKAQIAGKMKETKTKAVEKQARALMEKIDATENILKAQQAELEELFLENGELFN